MSVLIIEFLVWRCAESMPDPPISAAAVRKSDSNKHDFGWEKFRLMLMVSVCGNVEDAGAFNSEEFPPET